MDRKSIIIVASAILLLVVVQVASRKIFPDVPVPHAAAVTNAPAQSEPGRVVDSPVTPSIGAPTAPRANFSTNVAEETITVSSDRARYTFTSHGGGLKSVELTQYPETVSRQSAKNPLTNGVATLNTRAPAPVMAILGDTNIQGDGIFALTQTANGVRAEKLLPGGLRVVKEFQVASNYLVSATVRVENTTAAALAVPAREVVVGTATPMAPDDNGQAVGVVWYDGQKTDEKLTAWFENKSFMGCSASVPHAEYRAGITNVVLADEWG